MSSIKSNIPTHRADMLRQTFSLISGVQDYRDGNNLWSDFGRQCRMVNANPFEIFAELVKEMPEAKRKGFCCGKCGDDFPNQAALNGHGPSRCKKNINHRLTAE